MKIHAISDVDREMQKRTDILKKTCSNSRKRLTKSSFAHLQYDYANDILYCSTAKVGTTFWGRVMYLLRKGQVMSPLDVPLTGEMKTGVSLKYGRLKSLDGLNSFMFVRNPYSRLLSAYVDKIYTPNPVYWNMMGSAIARKFRKPRPRERCFHDITFLEFVKHVVDALTKNTQLDEHFIPISKLCDVCNVNYKYIGKMETFKKDVFYVLNNFKLVHYSETLVNMTSRSVYDTIKDTAQAAVDRRKDVQKCMSLKEQYARIWRRMQIRGIISFNIENQFIHSNLDVITFNEVTNILHKYHLESIKKHNMKKEKHEAFIRAYRTIPLNVKKDLRRVYKQDFEHFDYEPEPADLFTEKHNRANDDIFDISK